MVPAIRAPGAQNALGASPAGLRASGRISSSTGCLRERGARAAVRGPTQGRAGSPSITDKAPESEIGSLDIVDWHRGGTPGAVGQEKSVRSVPVLAWQAIASPEALQPPVANVSNSVHGVVSRPGSRPGSRPNSRAGSESGSGLELFRDCDREFTSFLLQNGRTRFVEAGEVLIDGGRGDTDVYILRRGEADVEVGGCAVLQLAGGQAVFSEMKLLGLSGAVVFRAKTLCECRIFSQSVLLHARRAFPQEKHFLVQLKQSQQQLELKIERAARNGDVRHLASNKDSAAAGPQAAGMLRSESLPSLPANCASSLGVPLQAPTSGDTVCMEMPASKRDSHNSFARAMGVAHRAYSPGRSPSRSPSPEPTPLSEELRQRRLLVLSRLNAVCTSEVASLGGASTGASLGGASQKSSPHPASDSSASLMSVEPAFSSKGAPTRMAGTSIGASLEWLVMPHQAGVALPSGIVPSSGTGTTASSSVQASRPVTPRESKEMAKDMVRPTNHTHVPVADGLPGTEPDEDDELPRFISAEDDDDQLPRLLRAASRGTSRASTPAEVRRRHSRTSGQATPPHLAHGLAPGNVAANDFERTKSRLYEAARELVLPTRRCARDQQARPQRACLAECGRKLLAR